MQKGTQDSNAIIIIPISRFNSAQDNQPKRDEASLAELNRPESLDIDAMAYGAMTKQEQARVKRGLRAWSPALFPDGSTRRKESVEAISALVLDVDSDPDATPGGIVERIRARGWAGVVHTSISDKGEGSGARRFRVVLPLSRPLLPAEHVEVRDRVAAELNVTFDPATRTDHARLYYVPVALKGAEPFAEVVEGIALVPEAFMSREAMHAEAGSAGGALPPVLPADGAKGQAGDDPGRLQSADRARFDSALEWLLTHDPSGAPCKRGGHAAGGQRKTWLALACAIAHGTGKSEEGWRLFDDASKRAGDAYSAGDAREAWASVEETRRSGGVGTWWTWIVAQAYGQGWKHETSGGEIDFAAALAERWRGRFVVVLPAKTLLYRDELGIWHEDQQETKALAEFRAALAERVAQIRATDPKAAAQFSKRLDTIRACEQIVKTARRLTNTCEIGALDADAELLGVANGVLHLRERRLLSPGELSERGARVTRQCSAGWDERGAAPRWGRFILEICAGDTDLAAYLQELFGSSLYGNARRRHFVQAYGKGSNGKTVLIKAMGHVFGTYVGGISRRALMSTTKQGGGENYEMAGLAGKRFVWNSETEETDTIAAAVLKQISGGEQAQVRAIYGKPTEITPRFTVWMFTNYKPKVTDTSAGFWDRLRLFPLEVRFEGSDDDKGLSDKLQAEASGILRWAVEGFKRWDERGEKFEEPERVRRATQEYREDSDTLGLWISDCAVLIRGDRSLKASSSVLHASFCRWCGTENIHAWSKKRLVQALKERGAEPYHTAQERGLVGIALQPEEEAKAAVTLRELERTSATRAAAFR